ncbi:NAD synthetase / Glutamine amidotransferase chain of NAD synthetase [hydrothermal vent metagenome]|uniref:NAD(+) synthase (glutamine-hydrolyzing) n=1 Tax=hydrothermal vent metagenome TaxID=652676 RepID=A0A3B0TYJ6_9ZZZZ
MTNHLKIALAQINPTVGALEANLALGLETLATAAASGADIIMFAELFLVGYFPEDLLLKPRFVDDAMRLGAEFAAKSAKFPGSILLPTIWRQNDVLYNALLLIENGVIVQKRFKHRLPNDDVFYEKRYFEPGPAPAPLMIKGVLIGVPICEDIWSPPACAALKRAGAELLLCPNGSPYWHDKQFLRFEVARARISETGLPMLYLNQVGGQDELVFDGASFGMSHSGELVFEGKSFECELVVSDWQKTDGKWHCVAGQNTSLVSTDEAPWRACVLGLRDYIRKNHFTSVVLGLSGGIDSAVVAAIAVDALGAENVHAIMLPYRYTSKDSLKDARECATRLGVRYDIVPIGPPVEEVNASLGDIFAGLEPDIAEENIQSRMRGLVLMAVSNKLGSMLLTTGNKSEMAVGYATIYGDMNGGFNPIKDLLKTQVYHLADWRNSNMPGDCLGPSGKIIPETIINKAPSAELRPDQTDQDSLPPYPVLDKIITGLVEDELSVAQIEQQGFERDLIRRVEKMLYTAQYKRRQAAPGVKLSKKAFGIGRKYPITNGYRDKS